MHGWVQCLLPTVTILTTLPLLVATSYGQTCDRNSLDTAIEQLQDNQKRSNAQTVLQQCGEESVRPLASALSVDVATTRLYAAETLRRMGWEAKAAFPELVAASQEDSDLQVRNKAIQALSAIGQDSKTHADQLQGWQTGEIQDLQDLQKQMDTVITVLEKDKQDWATKAKDLETLRLAHNALKTELRHLTHRQDYQVASWGQSHPWIVLIGVGAIAVATVYGTIFRLRPLWVLKVGDEAIQAIANIPHVGVALSGVLKVFLPLKYHPRVLDAWVEKYWQQAQQAFLELPTVQDRQIHITLPVHLKQSSIKIFINGLVGCNLVATFQKRLSVLLITGEGGSGKTSLACQIAQWGLNKQLVSHRLLPVLIETELDEKKTLMEAIRGQINTLINETDIIPPDLLEKLLQHQRILVIVDHFSEMSEATRQQIKPDLPTFPAKALVITSRLEESLDGVSKTILNPLRIEADRLLGFMQAYVRWRLNKQNDPFIDDEYAAACDRLRRMVGQRNITVLLARLYAEQMIEQQQGAGGMLPASVPELMLSYLNQLNRTIEPAEQLDYLEVQQAAQQVAWECLKQTYRPTSALREAVIESLQHIRLSKAPEATFKYLEERLRLVHILEPGDKIRIILDPLAEYLAAICVVKRSTHENSEVFWQFFLDSIDPILVQSNDPPAAIQGFLLAVRDVCLLYQTEARIPIRVPEELARRAGLDPEALHRAEDKRRIRLLISELSAPELEYRIRAANDLGQRGTAARIAAPNLIGMLDNRNQTLEARQAAAQALGNIGIGAKHLLALLIDLSDELAIRRSAAEALGMMKAGQTELCQLLESADQHVHIRQGAARALSLIGAPSGEAVPMLIVNLQSDQIITQVKSIPVWREPITDNLTLDIVAIPGGEFLMGSPPDEVERDIYTSYYPDTEGKDVEAQHRVMVPSFSLGQFPVTQNQWRAIAALPKVNRDLNPDPASFKGDNRPVEQISWYEAVEFCDRLSKYTGREYRLPSEAEWEYACRSGTTTPFHFGDTISTDLANYDGNDAYNLGTEGEHRQATTEIGEYGVANTFGLCDMHGNVFEWCLDHWHPSYEGAPTDGSAWVTDGDEGRRIVRGGSCNLNMRFCRSAYRDWYTPGLKSIGNVGFRVCCSDSRTE
jgi:formylglycine-generating enzyme required for sulfatase activity